MNKFWKNALINGALLGLIASAFYLVEQICLIHGRITLMSFVWLVAAVLYVMLLSRFAKRYRATQADDEGLSFGKAFGFLVMLIVVASVIKGLIQWLYCNVVMGYTTYVERMIASLMGYIDGNGGMPASVQPMFEAQISMLHNAPAPGIFGTIWGVVTTNVIFCGMVSLIIAAVVKRDAKPFSQE